MRRIFRKSMYTIRMCRGVLNGSCKIELTQDKDDAC